MWHHKSLLLHTKWLSSMRHKQLTVDRRVLHLMLSSLWQPLPSAELYHMIRLMGGNVIIIIVSHTQTIIHMAPHLLLRLTTIMTPRLHLNNITTTQLMGIQQLNMLILMALDTIPIMGDTPRILNMLLYRLLIRSMPSIQLRNTFNHRQPRHFMTPSLMPSKKKNHQLLLSVHTLIIKTSSYCQRGERQLIICSFRRRYKFNELYEICSW